MGDRLLRGLPKFYPEAYFDRQDRVKVKINCLEAVSVGDNVFFVRGSAVGIYSDNFSTETGKRIAKQRADKVLEWFHAVGYDPNALLEGSEFSDKGSKVAAIQLKYVRNVIHMKLLTQDKLSDLEKCMLGPEHQA